MSELLSKEKTRLLEIIAGSFDENKIETEAKDADMEVVYELAYNHALIPFLYNELKKYPLSDEKKMQMEPVVRKGAATFYKLLRIAKDVIRILGDAGVDALILKGASVARFYPMPESRRSGDVDVLLADPGQIGAAEEALFKAGYKKAVEGDVANHHQLWGTPDNHVMELHTMLVEPFDDAALNRYVDERYALGPDDILRVKVLGTELPVMYDDRLAFHLLLHMMMDFYRSGFGLRRIIDWTVFWNRKVEPERVKAFLNDVRACDVTGFFSVVTSACIRYLGLRTDGSGSFTMQDDAVFFGEEKLFDLAGEELCAEFINDVIDTDSKGKKATDRMVASESTGILGLIREYHHQTVLTFPRASKGIVTLPVLYVIMLIRFLRNNRTVRGGQSVSGIIKETQKRSRLVKRIKETGRQQI